MKYIWIPLKYLRSTFDASKMPLENLCGSSLVHLEYLWSTMEVNLEFHWGYYYLWSLYKLFSWAYERYIDPSFCNSTSAEQSCCKIEDSCCDKTVLLPSASHYYSLLLLPTYETFVHLIISQNISSQHTRTKKASHERSSEELRSHA